MTWSLNTMAGVILGKSLGGPASRLALVVGLAAAVSSVSQAQQATGQIQIGTSFDCSRLGTGQSIPALVCQTPELQFADLHQMQAYYTLRHAQPQRQQELRSQFTARIQALVRECSTDQIRASGSQPACVTQALGNLRNFWLEQLQQTGNAAALEESRLPSGNLVGAQQALKTSGFLPANAVVDGVYGSGTREAIARFQAERGIASNGFLTQPTLVALRRAAIAGTGPAGAPAAASSSGAPATQQPAAGSSQQAAQAQPAQRTQTSPPSNTQQTSPRSAASPAPTDATLQQQLATAARAIEARDYATALRIYRPLAEHGVAAAQGGMSRLYGNGWGVTRDDREALRWARLGAGQDDPVASNTLGFMLREGRGVARDDAEAVRWFRRSAEQGNANAQVSLGAMHMEGRGVARNDAEALRWFRLAADQGLARAQANLGWMYAEGRGVPRNTEEAVRWYQRAAAQGDTIAQRNLSQLEGTMETRRVIESYKSRNKTILEQVLNYTSFAIEDGRIDNTERLSSFFWISGYRNSHRCVMTQLMIEGSSLLVTDTVDLREFNEQGFRIRRLNNNEFMVGDERRQIPGMGVQPMERLQRAWSLVFRECPGRRSAF